MITISISSLLAICAAVVTVSAAITAVAKLIKFLKQPADKQNENIQNLTGRMAKAEEKLDTDMERLEDLETGLKYSLEALLALLSHALDGNDVDGLKKAKTDLNKYLLGKVER